MMSFTHLYIYMHMYIYIYIDIRCSLTILAQLVIMIFFCVSPQGGGEL